MDAKTTLGEPRLLLDVAALETNLRTLRRTVPANVKLCAVLKADAYGHGAPLVARMIADIEARQPFLKVDQFAVATFEEAEQLHGFEKPIMLLRPIDNVFLGRQRQLLEQAILRGWTLTLASPAAADDIARVAIHLQKRASVQIMLDTGMARCGVSENAFDTLLERTLHHPSLRLAGISTHFVNSEIPGDPVTIQQLRRFNAAIDRHPILESIPKHAANSGAIFLTPRAHFDVVRPGISLYGIDPTGRPNVERPLRPVLKWTAPIMAIHDIAPGQSVGYNQNFTAIAPTRVAVIPVGYADGYPRAASNRAVMMLNDTPCGVVGNVSMDMITLDITRAGDVGIGDEVTLIDADPHSPASIYPLARAAGTIPYELLTRIGPRVKRVGIGMETETDAPLGQEAD
ncbi:MAG: alanine racemase [Tepidisphaeraceae bacterium]